MLCINSEHTELSEQKPPPGLDPCVISVKADEAFEYSQGFKNPSTGLPLAIRRSLINAMTLEKTGAVAEVPETGRVSP
jgi:predicted outer membrane lipoprotein